MAKLIMWNIITLDGYFEGEKNWDLSFHDLIWCPELERFSIEQLTDAGCLIFGRVTYEGMKAYWTKAKGKVAEFMNSLPKVVCSTTLHSTDWNNTTLLKQDIVSEIASLKLNSKKNLFVLGSANLSETLIREGLFDEYRLAIAPVIAGKGRHLFSKGLPESKLSLSSSKPLETGGVVLTYGREGHSRNAQTMS